MFYKRTIPLNIHVTKGRCFENEVKFIESFNLNFTKSTNSSNHNMPFKCAMYVLVGQPFFSCRFLDQKYAFMPLHFRCFKAMSAL